jgi:hypothetical protein
MLDAELRELTRSGSNPDRSCASYTVRPAFLPKPAKAW